MPGPARAGLFIYAKDLRRVARFHEVICGMVRLHETSEILVLESPDIQLVVHQIPPHIASTIEVSSPAQRREATALKFFFTVPSIAAVREVAPGVGGEVDTQQWTASGFIACNASDPEGNIVQLRESTV